MKIAPRYALLGTIATCLALNLLLPGESMFTPTARYAPAAVPGPTPAIKLASP